MPKFVRQSYLTRIEEFFVWIEQKLKQSNELLDLVTTNAIRMKEMYQQMADALEAQLAKSNRKG